MKYPALLRFDEALARLPRFDAVIDVRSPAEFLLDHLPGAINCPVLDDQQRITIGTLYKQVSPFDARKLGAVFAYGNFITVAINFIILAFVIFIMVKQINKLRKDAPPPAPAPTAEDVLLLREIRDSLKK